MKKKLLMVFLLLGSLVLVTSCGKKAEEPKKEDEPVKVGGWELNTSITNTIMRDEDEIFKKAVANYTDMELEAIGYLGSQVVAGTNHMYLCKATKDGETTFKVAIIYADLKGNNEVIKVSDFKIENYANKEIEANNEEMTGGWTASSDCGENALTEEERDIFSKATENLTGVSYKPVATLATQLVSGKNYAVLAVGATTTETPVYNIYILTIYKDLSNESKVTSIAVLDLSNFN